MTSHKAVISLSKIENLKAIHNGSSHSDFPWKAVISLSKIENLKAIHNTAGIRRNENMKQESETGKSNRDLATIKPNPGFTVYDEDAKAGYFFMTSS